MTGASTRHSHGRVGLAAFLLLITAASLAVFTQPAALRFVSTPWPPFTNEPGQPRIVLDLVEAALGRIGVQSSTSIVVPAQFTVTLLSGKVDGTAAAWRDSQREKVLLYSEPYFENRLILVGRKGSDVTALSLGDLKGKKVAIVEGYAYGDDIDKAGPTFVRSRREEASLELLLTGVVDYTLMDQLVVEFLVAQYETEAKTRLEFGATPLLIRKLHLAIRRTFPDAAGIITRFNAQMKTMVADRTYHRLLHLEWISADVDGDGIPEYIPQSDKAGTAPPSHVYALSWTDERAKSKVSGDRYYLGGRVYNSWSDVPDSYKVSAQGAKDSNKSTLSVFTFSWK
jgi:polar amino acid transport system substrate-binding protein